MSAVVLRKLQQARQQLESGEIDAAAALCEDIVRRAPRNPDALWLLASARLMLNRAAEAVPLLQGAIEASPRHGAALEHLGLAYLMLADYGEAEKVLRKASALPGAPYSVSMRLGLALFHQNKHIEAISELKRAVRLEPQDPDTHLNLGRAYGAQREWALARQQFEIVLSRFAQHADALYNMGVVSAEQNHIEDARKWFEQCVSLAPRHLEARERLAQVCLELGRFPEARRHLTVVTSDQPANAAALRALANATFQCGALDEALQIARNARDLDPDQSGPYDLLAQIHHVRGELDLAAEELHRGFTRTGAGPLLGALVHVLHRQCDWPKWSNAWEQMKGRLGRSADLGSPFWLLCEATTASEQLAYAREWTALHYPSNASMCGPAKKAHSPRRLRIGYFSGDFHQHPVACLIAEVLELHDRSRFEVHAYSYGPDDQSSMRARLRNAVEHFEDVAWEPDDVVAERIRAAAPDILVDLKGFTAGDRLRVMAKRPCAVQIAWLGYPGTTGADFIDYVIADSVLVPAGAESDYSERILRLPHCYQPNDRKRNASRPRSRREYGLPERGFVFCCFNQANKITPEVFSVWMALLRAVPDSVLWLLEDNRWASQNLASAAAATGLDPARVVMAPRLPPADHLARYRVADLALDTFPYTSHTTGSDALWLGCPLVALCGGTFASRVSASLLTNCGMGALVAHSLDEYRELALRLATDAGFMQDMRRQLDAAHDRAPLFDATLFARDLEQLYLALAS